MGKRASDARNNRSLLSGRGRIAVRFRSVTITLFVIAFIIIAAVMAVAFSNVIGKLSAEYARRYAVTSAEALSAHINRDIGLMSKAARSSAVIEWMLDEYNEQKKAVAFEELMGIIGELYSFNLYVGLESSLHEYKVDGQYDADYFTQVAMLDRDDPEYDWYFDCISSPHDYLISVGIDDIMQRKRVWLDYEVSRDGVPVGVICTGLEFSHVAWELFSQFDSDDTRGLVIDDKGDIHIDSTFMSDAGFLYNDFEVNLRDEFSDGGLLADIRLFLDGIDGYFGSSDESKVFKLSGEAFRNMTIMPIKNTNWSVVILSGAVSRYNILLFVPVSVAVLVLLLAFTFAVIAVNSRLIFRPIARLSRSLPQLVKSLEAQIYGSDRDDEIGELSRTIRDLFTKANVDALTGIYNRRYIENNLAQTMEFLSRSNGRLSVLMLDIDFFKKYNDNYGHDQGDMCLKAVAGALASGVSRSNDFVARYGGEEFLAVLPNTDETGARAIAEKLLESIRMLDIPHAGNDAAPCVTISIGVTTGSVEFTQTQEEYIKSADEALYMSKQNGRNRYTFLRMGAQPS